MPLSRVERYLALVLPVAGLSVGNSDRSSAAPRSKGGRAFPITIASHDHPDTDDEPASP